MPLVTLWVNTGGNEWERRLVDPANLPLEAVSVGPPPGPKPKPKTDYVDLARRFNNQIARDFDRNFYSRLNAKLLNFQHKQEMAQLMSRIAQRERSLAHWASLANDSDYIAAMFSLYSQQRSRLL